MMAETVAALDCGTNTLRLLVATADETGNLKEFCRELRFAGLGQDVDQSGVFADEAMARGWAIVDEYVPMIRKFGATKARFVATSAARDAANRNVFFDGVRERLGIEPELISGDEEAALSFSGAISGIDLGEGSQAATGTVLVMDSGGGSTELVRGDRSGEMSQDISLNIGSRRVRERYLHDDPPTAEQIGQARVEINRMLDECPVELSDIETFIGVAGTVTTMAALHLGLKEYDREQVHGCEMTTADVESLADKLLGMSAEQILALGPVAPERAKVLSGGALVVAEVTKRVPVNLQASESDILDGVVWSILCDGKGHPLAD